MEEQGSGYIETNHSEGPVSTKTDRLWLVLSTEPAKSIDLVKMENLATGY